jgi:hypothetical protein
MVLAPTVGKEDIKFPALISIFFLTPLIYGIMPENKTETISMFFGSSAWLPEFEI